jgi:hypothetical protein
VAPGLWKTIQEKIGFIDEDRYLANGYPEYSLGQVDRLWSAVDYPPTHDSGNINGMSRTSTTDLVIHAAGSVIGATALVAGTTVGAGMLAIPASTIHAGFVPSTVALTIAWGYMCVSGLLLAELILNRIARTGRPGIGLLDLMKDGLDMPWSRVGTYTYFFLHYAVSDFPFDPAMQLFFCFIVYLNFCLMLLHLNPSVTSSLN